MLSLTFGLFTQVSGSGPLGPLVSDALPLNSYGEALQVKNKRFCQLFKLANKGMNQ